MKELLVQQLEKLHPIDYALKERIMAVTSLIYYKGGTFLLNAVQVCSRANFIPSGLVRFYYISSDKEITSRFMDEGYIATSWISFYTRMRGNEYIQALEDTIVLSIDHADIQRLYTEFPDFNIIGCKQLEHSFMLAEQRTQILRKQTAAEKYKCFLDRHHSLIRRAPLGQIASYLGMNIETLSRVRSRFRKKQAAA
jgi:CRP-like cAMP-binding protein